MKQILVVDDEPDRWARLELDLKRNSYQPRLAGDGTAAVELLQAEHRSQNATFRGYTQRGTRA